MTGMLVQEHVDRLMKIRVPDGWEESIANAECASTDTEGSDSSDDRHEPRVGTTSDAGLEVTKEKDEDDKMKGSTFFRLLYGSITYSA